jgi:hypothetical protein
MFSPYFAGTYTGIPVIVWVPLGVYDRGFYWLTALDLKLFTAYTPHPVVKGFGRLISADVVLGLAPNLVVVMIGVALCGLDMGMTQSLLSALFADEAPHHLRCDGLQHVQLCKRRRPASG